MNPDIIKQVVALLPAKRSAALIAAVRQKKQSPEKLQATIREALKSIDWDEKREQISELLGQILPLEKLVPETYQEWRPVVRDGFFFIVSRVSPSRLLPKLIEQMTLPADMPLEQRVIILITRMPSLQKIGQIVARNQNLDPAFREQLTNLENSIRDFSVEEIASAIEQQLQQEFKTYRIKLRQEILAEGSVGAVLPFTWLNPQTNKRERGVFKALKPYASEYFAEELQLLKELADFFEANREKYGLAQLHLRDWFDDVRLLLEQEVRFRNEQANLTAAHREYSKILGVRVPRLIPELCTPTITTMSEEQGVKITQSYCQNPDRRKQVAAHLTEVLIGSPLFATEEKFAFHADPHAGNIFINEKTGELILFDWALTEHLDRDQRRQLLLLLLSVTLRDQQNIFNAIAALCRDDLRADERKADIVRGHVAQFIDGLSPFNIPGVSDLSTLLNELLLSGIRFSSAFIIFRKALFTLDGVIKDVAPQLRIDLVLIWYMVRNGALSAYSLFTANRSVDNFGLPFSFSDWMTLNFSVQSFGARMWWQTFGRMFSGR